MENADEAFATGAKRDRADGRGRMDLLPMRSLLRLAMVMEEGARHYGEHNWEKGIPIKNYIDHALHHLVKYQLGDGGEDHLGHALANLAMACDTEEMVMNGDLPGFLLLGSFGVSE